MLLLVFCKLFNCSHDFRLWHFCFSLLIFPITANGEVAEKECERCEDCCFSCDAGEASTANKDVAHGSNEIAERIDEREMLRPIGHRADWCE